MYTCRRTRRVISTSAVTPKGARPTMTARPPSLTDKAACLKVAGFPKASTAMSTPLPPVISWRIKNELSVSWLQML